MTTPPRSSVDPLDELEIKLGQYYPDGLVVYRVPTMLRLERGRGGVTVLRDVGAADGDHVAVLLSQQEYPSSPHWAYSAHVVGVDDAYALAVAALAGEEAP